MENAISQAPAAAISAGMITFIVLISVWSLIWKAIALWKAARNGSKPWYTILLILNTAGILEIIYIFAVAGKNSAVKEKTEAPKTS